MGDGRSLTTSSHNMKTTRSIITKSMGPKSGRITKRTTKSNVNAVPLKPVSTFGLLERRIEQACDQMTAILRQIDACDVRLQRAIAQQQNHQVRQLQRRLSVLKSMYDMYYMYSSRKAAELMTLEATGLQPAGTQPAGTDMSPGPRISC